MTLRRTSPRAGTRWSILVLGVVALVLAVGANALAVHDIGEFELDKNASNNLNVTPLGVLGANINSSTTSIPVCQTGTPPATPFTILIEAERMTVTANAAGSFGGNCAGIKRAYTVTRGAGVTTAAAHSKSGEFGMVSLLVTAMKDGPDWDQVFASVTADGNDEGDDDKCIALGLAECSFVHDGIGPSTFIGGASKDHLPISGWQHTSGASPDKAEILNAYAAKAITDDDEQILYFGMDRYAVDGSTDIGFWFFRSEVTANPDGTFTGTHQGTLNSSPADNDILALATFTQGGAATNIRVFRWVGSGGNESGTINGPDGDAGDCIQDPPLTDDNLCGTVNNTSIEVPWTYQFKGANTGKWVPTGGLFEGGINLTALGLEGCFSSFLAETRSSPEITAILKDFTLGSFEACDTDLTTTPADASGTALTDGDDADTLPEAQLGTGSAGVNVTDTAVLDVKGTSTWSGSLEFFICGPIATGTCDTGGVSVGSQLVDQDTSPIVSNSANLTSVGRYCWRGVFTSTTEGVPGDTDASEGECFEVLPVDPDLSTTAWSTGDSTGSAVTAPVSFGTALYDRAYLTGTANKPGTNGGTYDDPDNPGNTITTPYTSINATNGAAATGSISFTLVEKIECSTAVSGTTGTNPETGVSVSGDGYYFSSGFTPAAPGTYSWQASYTGDSPNTNSTSHNDDCSDTNEDVTVQQLQPAMTTSQSFVPNDSATVTVGAGAGDLDGYVVFQLYVDDTDCSEAAAYTSGQVAVSDTDDVGDTSLTDTVSSSNTTSYNTSSTFNWVVSFTSNNSAHLNVTSECGNETSSLTISDGTSRPSPTPAPEP